MRKVASFPVSEISKLKDTSLVEISRLKTEKEQADTYTCN